MSKKIQLAIRISLFLVYFWFGALKLLQLSPAEELVHALFDSTLAFLMPFTLFYSLFSAFECFLGLLFLVKGFEKHAYYLLLAHIFTTAMPLFLLPEFAWSGFLVPTLVGQYILKNGVLVVAAWALAEATEVTAPKKSKSKV